MFGVFEILNNFFVLIFSNFLSNLVAFSSNFSPNLFSVLFWLLSGCGEAARSEFFFLILVSTFNVFDFFSVDPASHRHFFSGGGHGLQNA